MVLDRVGIQARQRPQQRGYGINDVTDVLFRERSALISSQLRQRALKQNKLEYRAIYVQ